MRLWCSALGETWTWTWRPYLGVWLLVLLLAAAYWRLYRRHPAADGAKEERRWRILAAAGGLAGMWLVLDWPVGALAGYLLSVHTIQFVGLMLIIPPLLLLGLPVDDATLVRPGLEAPLRAITRPIRTLVTFNVIVIASHLPSVVDRLMATQLGSFAIDMSWILGGLLFWWPLARAWPDPPLGPGAKIGYTIAGAVVHMLVSILLIASQFPLYRVFELAPPVAGRVAVDDQQAAGAVMQFGGTMVALATISVLFYLWQRAERRKTAAA